MGASEPTRPHGVPGASEPVRPIKRVGRYTVFQQIAAGGMATVHLARLAGPAGFRRVVAVKALHPHLVRDPEFTAMLIEEARLAARIRHPNVVPTLDVVAADGELFIVMEYVEGESLSVLRKAARRQEGSIPASVCAAIMAGVLHGLHAAHEAQSEKGEPLHIVHRDVSPQNILVGVDGVARVLDFGVAKALQAHQETRAGQIKGKSSYMAPEQIRGEPLTRRVDIFAAAVVFWELLTARRLFGGTTEEERVYKVLRGDVPLPSTFCPGLPAAIDDVVMKGIESDPNRRFATALSMAEAIEGSVMLASQRVVGDWVTRIGAHSLSLRTEALRKVETTRLTSVPPALAAGGASDAAAPPAGEQGVPGSGPSDAPMGRSSATGTTWWRDRRVVIAAIALAATGVGALAFRERPVTARNHAAGSAPWTLVHQPPNQSVEPASLADPPPAATSADPPPPAPANGQESGSVVRGRKPASARPPSTPSRPPSKPASPRTFRPTEL